VPAPPAWLDDGRVLVETRSGTLIVGVDSGDVMPGPEVDGGTVLVDVSADGSRAAIAPEGGQVEVRSRDAWLQQSGEREASLGGGLAVAAIALDRQAERLAVMWQQESDPGTLIVYRAQGGWHETSRRPLPNGSERGALAWLP
jgi:hypothetical protein